MNESIEDMLGEISQMKIEDHLPEAVEKSRKHAKAIADKATGDELINIVWELQLLLLAFKEHIKKMAEL